jgi:hypothetical protein
LTTTTESIIQFLDRIRQLPPEETLKMIVLQNDRKDDDSVSKSGYADGIEDSSTVSTTTESVIELLDKLRRRLAPRVKATTSTAKYPLSPMQSAKATVGPRTAATSTTSKKEHNEGIIIGDDSTVSSLGRPLMPLETTTATPELTMTSVTTKRPKLNNATTEVLEMDGREQGDATTTGADENDEEDITMDKDALSRWLPAAMAGLAITATAVLVAVWLCHRRLPGRGKSGIYATGAPSLGSVGSVAYGRRGRRGGRWPPAHFMSPGPPVILGYEAEADSKLVEERRRDKKRRRRQRRRWLIMPSEPPTAALHLPPPATSAMSAAVVSSAEEAAEEKSQMAASASLGHVVRHDQSGRSGHNGDDDLGHKVTEL